MTEESEIKWIPVVGKWAVDPDVIHYRGPGEPTVPHGFILCDRAFRDGSVSVDVSCSSWDESAAARILLGYDAKTQEYISIGIGGYGRAFVISRFRAGVGWAGITAVGEWTNVGPGRTYQLDVSLTGQAVVLRVDGVKVIDHRLDQPLTGLQSGLFVWGSNEVEFRNFRVGEPSLPQGFVIMEFSEIYDSLYREVLLKVADKAGMRLRRADDITGPGVILQDIVTDISEATVVVAEISSRNPNVFYELGFSHAMNKPTILLAKRGEELPFDVAGYRCIFYDDSIAGKSKVENEFLRHLLAILGKS